MIVIRKEQMDALARLARLRFEDRIVDHFTSEYPRETRQAGGPSQIRKVVQGGLERAEVYGFKTEKQVILFVALLFMLGCDFDTDPQMPWAKQINSKTVRNPELRINMVYEAAVEYLTATAGEDCEFVVRAMLRIRAHDFAATRPSIGEQFVQDTLATMQMFCPEKAAYQGDDINRRLIVMARRTAGRYGITANRGVVQLATLMFMLGSGIDHDPLHPWVEQALTAPANADEDSRIDTLHREALAHIALSLQPDEIVTEHTNTHGI